MSEEEWEKTLVYQQGDFYVQWGTLLMNPNTKMNELVSLARRYNFRVDVNFAYDKPPETEEGDE